MMALSTADMRFEVLFLKFSCAAPIGRGDRRRKTRPGRLTQYQNPRAAGVRSDAGDCIHQIKTKAPIVRSQSDSVKRRRCTLAARQRGLSLAEAPNGGAV
jgi:hypothetical protein